MKVQREQTGAMERLRQEHVEAIRQTKEMYEQNLREMESKQQKEVNQHKETLEETIKALQNELRDI